MASIKDVQGDHYWKAHPREYVASLRGVMPAIMRTWQVAALLDVSPHTLVNWRKAGYGPPLMRITGTTVRYSGPAVEAWLRNGSAANPEKVIRRKDWNRGPGAVTSAAAKFNAEAHKVFR